MSNLLYWRPKGGLLLRNRTPNSTLVGVGSLGGGVAHRSAKLALGALEDPLDNDTAKDRVDKISNAKGNCFRYSSGQ